MKLFLDEFPDLYDETEIDLLDTYRILDTPGFTNESGISHEATSQVVDSRNDTGGWCYIRSTGEIFANLPKVHTQKIVSMRYRTAKMKKL